MTTEFGEFHDELRAVAGELLAKDRTIDWPRLVDAGWAGLEVPDRCGGAGATFAETAVILDQIGRAGAASGYLGGAVLPVGVLTLLTQDEHTAALLSALADGSIRFAVVTDGFSYNAGTISGHAQFVFDAAAADTLLVLVEGGVAVIPANAVTVAATPVVDETRSLATVSADSVRAEAMVRFAHPDVHATIRQRGEVAIACDSLGIAEQMLTATVDYVKVRHQFGRPIGSFQAVKHACADMLVAIEVSRQLVTDAVARVADDGDAETAAAMAKAYACSAAVEVAGKAMQLHGGIGYTWESGIHTYLKRAALNRSLFGSPAAQRKKIARRYL